MPAGFVHVTVKATVNTTVSLSMVNNGAVRARDNTSIATDNATIVPSIRRENARKDAEGIRDGVQQFHGEIKPITSV